MGIFSSFVLIAGQRHGRALVNGKAISRWKNPTKTEQNLSPLTPQTVRKQLCSRSVFRPICHNPGILCSCFKQFSVRKQNFTGSRRPEIRYGKDWDNFSVFRKTRPIGLGNKQKRKQWHDISSLNAVPWCKEVVRLPDRECPRELAACKCKFLFLARSPSLTPAPSEPPAYVEKRAGA